MADNNNSNNWSSFSVDNSTVYDQRSTDLRSNSFSGNSSTRNYDALKRRIDADDKVPPRTLAIATMHQVKVERNFTRAVYLYNELKKILRLISSRGRVHPGDISLFRKTVGALVRYAPTAQQAMDIFGDFFAEWDDPFRTMSTELILFTNLIYVVSKGGSGSGTDMKDALRLVELSLELGVLAIEPENYVESQDDSHRRGFAENSLEVYKNVCSKVLRYFGLDFASDGRSLVKRDIVSQRRRM